VRRRALLAFSLPLAAIGCLAGHAVGYAVVGTSRTDAAIHGYLGYTPPFLAAAVSFVALAVVLRLSGRLQGRPVAWPFAVVPPIAFLVQEVIERLAAGLPAHGVLEPAVYVGLAAQLPIGFLAFLAGRALLRVADVAASTLVPPTRVVLEPIAPPALAPTTTVVRAALAFDHLSRAPPLD
jgi:hypothetical protein